MDIPARYVSSYAFRLDPPDFHATFEAFLGGRWYLFDATRKAALDGLIRIGVGRDAAEVSFSSFFGKAESDEMKVSISSTDRGTEGDLTTRRYRCRSGEGGGRTDVAAGAFQTSVLSNVQVHQHRHMVGWLRLPAAGVAQDSDAYGGCPPAAALPRYGPAAGPGWRRSSPSPGSSTMCRASDRRARSGDRIDPADRALHGVQPLDLDRGVRHDVHHLLVRPDIMFERGDVEVADHDHRPVGRALRRPPCRHFVQEAELVLELDVDRRVGNVAARWDIDAVDLDPVDMGDGVAAVLFLAPVLHAFARNRAEREDCYAIVALHAMDHGMDVTALRQGASGKVSSTVLVS